MSLEQAIGDFCIRDSGISPDFLSSLSQRAPNSTVDYLNKLARLRSDPRQLTCLNPIPQANEAKQVQAYYAAVQAQLEKDSAQIKTAVDIEKKKHFAVLMQHAKSFKQRFALENAAIKYMGNEYHPLGFLTPGLDYRKLCPSFNGMAAWNFSQISNAQTFDDLIAFVEPITTSSQISDYMLLEARPSDGREPYFVVTSGARSFVLDQLEYNFSPEELSMQNKAKSEDKLDENYSHNISNLPAYHRALAKIVAGSKTQLSDLNQAESDQLDKLILKSLGLKSMQQLSEYLKYMLICCRASISKKLELGDFISNFRSTFAQLIFKNPKELNSPARSKTFALSNPLVLDRLYMLMLQDSNLLDVHQFWTAAFPEMTSDKYCQNNFGFRYEADKGQNRPAELSNFIEQLRSFLVAQKTFHMTSEGRGFFQLATDYLNQHEHQAAELPDLGTAIRAINRPDEVEMSACGPRDQQREDFAKFLSEFNLEYLDALSPADRHDFIASLLSMTGQSCSIIGNKGMKQWSAAEQAIVPRLLKMSKAIIEEFCIAELADGKNLCFLPLAATQGIADQNQQQKQWQLVIVAKGKAGFDYQKLDPTVRLIQQGTNLRSLDLGCNIASTSHIAKLAKSIAEQTGLSQDQVEGKQLTTNFARVLLKVCATESSSNEVFVYGFHSDCPGAQSYDEALPLIDSNLLISGLKQNLITLQRGQAAAGSSIKTGIHQAALLLDQVFNRRNAFRSSEEALLVADLRTKIEQEPELLELFDQGFINLTTLKSLSQLQAIDDMDPKQKARLLKFFIQICRLSDQQIEISSFRQDDLFSSGFEIEEIPVIYEEMLTNLVSLLKDASVANKQVPSSLVNEVCDFTESMNAAITHDLDCLLSMNNIFKAKALSARAEAMALTLGINHELEARYLPLEDEVYMETFKPAKSGHSGDKKVSWNQILHLHRSCTGISPASTVNNSNRDQFIFQRLRKQKEPSLSLAGQRQIYFQDDDGKPFKFCAKCADRTGAALKPTKADSDLLRIRPWHEVTGGY
ncbi:MAG: hypothetical protein OXU45_04015 [Candidatus Melainabacteria bacterium]|nr:hypothetical protein [Candidatus Melainabacteria bacterium]